MLAEIAQGKSNTAIAEALFLTRHAIEKHINSIFAKLGLGSADDVSKRVKAALMFLSEMADTRQGLSRRPAELAYWAWSRRTCGRRVRQPWLSGGGVAVPRGQRYVACDPGATARGRSHERRRIVASRIRPLRAFGQR